MANFDDEQDEMLDYLNEYQRYIRDYNGVPEDFDDWMSSTNENFRRRGKKPINRTSKQKETGAK